MKKLIFIPFLLINLILSGANHYVKNGGNDALSGADDTNAWETITQVNAHTFVAGDSILFKRGDRFVGTITPGQSGSVGSYIVYGAYGTGDEPIITPNDTISGGITWTPYGSDGIYSTTDISYNPSNLLINGVRKIHKINDSFFSTVNIHYGNQTSLEILARSNTDSITTEGNHVKINFWDGIDGLYCYNSGTTYIRFRDGEDPNDSTFYISAVSSRGVYIYAQSYITICNLNIIGGDRGIHITGLSSPNATYNVIKNNKIYSSNQKISLLGAVHYTTISNNTITNYYLSPYEPGAWQGSYTYEDGVQNNLYSLTKYLIDTSESGNADGGIRGTGSNQNYSTINGNTVTNCVSCINVNGFDCNVYDNTVSGSSSIGIMLIYSCGGTEVYDNYLADINLPFRFGGIDVATYAPVVYYLYRNRVYNPDAGAILYIHSNVLSAASQTTAYLYHNSFICKTGLDVTGYVRYNSNGTGFIFINNIFSASGYNTSNYSWIDTDADLWKFYYNWMGGTYADGATPAVWASDVSNLQNYGVTLWDHSIDPPTFVIEGTAALDAAVDISQAFVLGVDNYSALPGFSPGYEYGTAPDMGYYEVEGDPDPVEPLVATTGIPTSITTNSALGSGAVTYAGGGTVSDRGICWGTSVDPTTAGSHVHSGSGLGSFTGLITGLVSNTTYHVRAFGTNETGTSYGSDVTFTTLESAIIMSGSVIVTSGGYIIKIE